MSLLVGACEVGERECDFSLKVQLANADSEPISISFETKIDEFCYNFEH